MPINKICAKCRKFHPAEEPCTKYTSSNSTMCKQGQPQGWQRRRTKRTELGHGKIVRVFNRCEGKCQMCEKWVPYKERQVDHIVPVYKGGTNEMSNLWLLCKDCHRAKTALDIKNRSKWLNN